MLMKLFSQPIPLPPPLIKVRGVCKREGRSPSLKSLPPLLLRGEILKESQREVKPLLYNPIPFPYEGRGIKGVG